LVLNSKSGLGRESRAASYIYLSILVSKVTLSADIGELSTESSCLVVSSMIYKKVLRDRDIGIHCILILVELKEVSLDGG